MFENVIVDDLNLGENGYRLRIDLRGHPTQALARAHAIAEATFKDNRWHITSVDGKMPNDYQHPSEMRMKVIITAFEV